VIANDVVTIAFQLIGVLDPGETPSATELTDGFQRLNDMLANWALERLNLTGNVVAVYSLLTGTPTYTMGPSGTLATTRPLHVTEATILQPAAGGGNIRQPLTLLTEKEWAALPFRDSTFATNPISMWFNPTFPLSTVNLYPVPTFSSARSIELHTWSTIASFGDQSTDVPFQPGYDRAIRYNLALELAGEYAAMPSAQVVQIAAEAKAALRMLNGTKSGAEPPMGPVNAIPQG
jgi:hypothetical protein